MVRQSAEPSALPLMQSNVRSQYPNNFADTNPRRISILGATGSIGENTLDLIHTHRERFHIVAVTANNNVARLAQIAIDFDAEFAAIADPSCYEELKVRLAGKNIRCGAGMSAVKEAACYPSDIVIAAIVGSAGLEPTLAALEQGRLLALANKECLVCAGALFMHKVQMHNSFILPLDSEHNAIFQVLEMVDPKQLEKVTLTASGGPFRAWSLEQMIQATPEQALNHPNWRMGNKITIDSATLMNKGLEVIEAHHLFSLHPDQLEILVHPQSIIHGLVSYSDGSVLAQLSMPDMRTPISVCLEWPKRGVTPVKRLDLAAIGSLSFERPDFERFPALRLALAALHQGSGSTNILNAANEIAVEAFLNGQIGFTKIAEVVEQVLENAETSGLLSEPMALDEALFLDKSARNIAYEILHQMN